MRVAVVHSFYDSRSPSGENIVVEAQVQALSDAGHDVRLIAQHTDLRQQRPAYPLRAGWTVATGRGPTPGPSLREFRPDVVHVHNLFPNWGTDWLDGWDGRVVATLHNFRPLCAAGTLYRDGKVCTLCPDGDPWAGLARRCYRGSRVATAPLALRNRRGLAHDAVLRRADHLVALSARAAEVYSRYGVAPERLSVVPNFVADPYGVTAPVEPNGRWVYAGRLSPEKGVLELLAHWPADHALDVIGDGPLLAEARLVAPPNVKVLGRLPRHDLLAQLPRYRGMVVPSRWIEGGQTLVLGEALAAGLPVVALTGSSAADVVSNLDVGAIVASDTGWAQALAQVGGDDEVGRRARAAFVRFFRVDTWLGKMLQLYEAGQPR